MNIIILDVAANGVREKIRLLFDGADVGRTRWKSMQTLYTQG
jgi:hypothetical protein